ncbi:hypothetical protein HMPREF1487_04322 [Pseudomonas sp. HPB0071]|uniref:Phytanoyl-CoA dioxygenase (PhyH) n=1 Tax=Pseudomonas luteola TaxID=47886 RepID=A0A2X2CJG7_PSELU|nr:MULTISPECIES: phytanoyl-CoA dioxygenase family protein [Pseudomonas]ENA37404.1 hypothetical protein HMPREF1487_04322 [Pseudomonas sp. HPB0071]MBF8642247.1 phytanoyl-CoA dioxygenase family protein [Pseudomonas zeshuii]RRW48366.1 phytanoyl-CoA dioxygenase [Pseudomonas luteola]SHJ24930.1 Phytanoyl-CoA dioxygenase (PhyH) [Pseudomonas zeshuii]SPZ07464.1 Phytanoyl-CoA dioxygenase (PhyH) [Pseudomonas luteola]
MTTQFSNPLPGVPSVESPFFQKIFADPSIDEWTKNIAHELNENGFAVIDFPDEEIEARAERIKRDLHDQYDWKFWHEVGFERNASLRLMNAWETNEDVRSIATNQKVMDLLSTLFGRKAWPFQTLNFPVGTQQPFHTDSVHFSSTPERFMCGVWTALEDIDEDAGPLVYYPGSHKWPIYTNEHIGICAVDSDTKITQAAYEPMWNALVEAHGVQPQYFRAKKGQSLIWLSNLLHGGIKHQNQQKTRWSQVTHYFFEDCAYYIPMHSDPFYGNIVFRELSNIITGEVVKNQYVGREIPQQFIQESRLRRFNEAPKEVPENFDPQLYLAANPDLLAAGVDPAQHYINHGWKERRALRP